MRFITHSLLLALLTFQASSESPQAKYNVAVIAAIASILAALISATVTVFSVLSSRKYQLQLESQKAELAAKTQEGIELLKAQLGEQGKERDARRDYEYDTRKRLYAEVEPIRFNLFEALEEAHYRVKSLARTARSGNLGIGNNSWLDGPGYYLRSTVYKILSPVAYYRLLQRRITFIDFSLDRDIALQYMLLKLYVRSFTDDFLIANLSPSLRYDPNAEDARTRVRKEPAVFSRQAFVLGDLECIADLLTIKEDGKTRVLQFGEFERLFAQDELDDNLQEAVNVFTFFSPEIKPVLARLLIVQAYFAQLILWSYKSNSDPSQLLERLDELLANRALQSELSWTDTPTDFAFVRSYLEPRIKQIEITASVPAGAR